MYHEHLACVSYQFINNTIYSSLILVNPIPPWSLFNFVFKVDIYGYNKNIFIVLFCVNLCHAKQYQNTGTLTLNEEVLYSRYLVDVHVVYNKIYSKRKSTLCNYWKLCDMK